MKREVTYCNECNHEESDLEWELYDCPSCGEGTMRVATIADDKPDACEVLFVFSAGDFDPDEYYNPTTKEYVIVHDWVD